MEPDDNQQDGVRFPRRKILQQIGGATALTATASQVSAQTNNSGNSDLINRSDKRVIEMKVTADIEDSHQGQILRSNSCSFTPSQYYVGEDRAFVIQSRSNEIASYSNHINTNLGLVANNNRNTSVQVPVTLSCDFNGYTGIFIELDDTASKYEFDTEIDDNATEVTRNDEQLMSVSSGEERTVELDQVSVPTYEKQTIEIDNPREVGDETVERYEKSQVDDVSVRPKLTVRDRGSIPIIYSSHQNTFPKSMPGSLYLISEANESEFLETIDHGNDIISIQEVKSQ